MKRTISLLVAMVAMGSGPAAARRSPDCAGKERCLLLPLGPQSEPDRKLLQYICGSDGTIGSVSRYRLDGTQGFASIDCWPAGEETKGKVWLIEFDPGQYSVWKRETQDGEFTWDTGLPPDAAFSEADGTLSASAACKPGHPGWRGRWIWGGTRFERLDYSEHRCIE